MMNNRIAFYIASAGALAGTMCLGFFLTAPPEADDRIGFYGDWDTFFVTPDYSESTERIAFEFGNQMLFGQPEIEENLPTATIDNEMEITPDYKLLGLAELDGKSVVLLGTGSGKAEKIAEGGATEEGWIVSEIGSSHATLRREDQSIQLSFYQKDGD